LLLFLVVVAGEEAATPSSVNTLSFVCCDHIWKSGPGCRLGRSEMLMDTIQDRDAARCGGVSRPDFGQASLGALHA